MRKTCAAFVSCSTEFYAAAAQNILREMTSHLWWRTGVGGTNRRRNPHCACVLQHTSEYCGGETGLWMFYNPMESDGLSIIINLWGLDVTHFPLVKTVLIAIKEVSVVDDMWAINGYRWCHLSLWTNAKVPNSHAGAARRVYRFTSIICPVVLRSMCFGSCVSLIGII